MTNELWKPIPGYLDLYEASDMGRVRNLRTGHVLVACRRGPSGHLSVSLRGRSFYVHTLVLLTFVGPRPSGMEACHSNSTPTDNRLGNLRWDTRLANMRDRDQAGGYRRGERHQNTNLTDDQVRSVRARKLRPFEIMKELGVSQTRASEIFRGKTWKHLI